MPNENGDEELYDEAKDPLEYTNLSTKPDYAVKKAELARLLPQTNAESLPGAKSGKGNGKAKDIESKKKKAKVK